MKITRTHATLTQIAFEFTEENIYEAMKQFAIAEAKRMGFISYLTSNVVALVEENQDGDLVGSVVWVQQKDDKKDDLLKSIPGDPY